MSSWIKPALFTACLLAPLPGVTANPDNPYTGPDGPP